MTPLPIAVFWERDGVLVLLLKQGADPNIIDDDSETPLLHAARGRFFTIAHQLLKFITDPNSDPPASKAPLIVAVKQKDQPLITLLLKKGADPDRRDAQGRTRLDHPVRHDFRGAVQTLLKYKANPGCTDKLSQTPLFHAALFGRVEIVRILLAAKPSPTLGSSDGKTPLERAETVAEGLKKVTNADESAQSKISQNNFRFKGSFRKNIARRRLRTAKLAVPGDRDSLPIFGKVEMDRITLLGLAQGQPESAERRAYLEAT